VTVVTLSSCSVFWAELGYVENAVNHAKAAALFDDEIGPWLIANCKGAYNPYGKGVWFSDQQDAALFKMMFHGRFE